MRFIYEGWSYFIRGDTIVDMTRSGTQESSLHTCFSSERMRTPYKYAVTRRTWAFFSCRSIVRNNSLYRTAGRMFSKQHHQTWKSNVPADVLYATVFKVFTRRRGFRITPPNGSTPSQSIDFSCLIYQAKNWLPFLSNITRWWEDSVPKQLFPQNCPPYSHRNIIISLRIEIESC